MWSTYFFFISARIIVRVAAAHHYGTCIRAAIIQSLIRHIARVSRRVSSVLIVTLLSAIGSVHVGFGVAFVTTSRGFAIYARRFTCRWLRISSVLLTVVSPMPRRRMLADFVESFVVVLVYDLINSFEAEFLESANSGSAKHRKNAEVRHPGFAYHELFIFAHILRLVLLRRQAMLGSERSVW